MLVLVGELAIILVFIRVFVPCEVEHVPTHKNAFGFLLFPERCCCWPRRRGPTRGSRPCRTGRSATSSVLGPARRPHPTRCSGVGRPEPSESSRRHPGAQGPKLRAGKCRERRGAGARFAGFVLVLAQRCRPHTTPRTWATGHNPNIAFCVIAGSPAPAPIPGQARSRIGWGCEPRTMVCVASEGTTSTQRTRRELSQETGHSSPAVVAIWAEAEAHPPALPGRQYRCVSTPRVRGTETLRERAERGKQERAGSGGGSFDGRRHLFMFNTTGHRQRKNGRGRRRGGTLTLTRP